MKQSDDNRSIPMTSVSTGKGRGFREDVSFYTDQIVNVILIGKPEHGKWVLIDTGMPKSGEEIIQVAEERFGKGSKPEGIILTHGHFDHVGGVVELINKWQVPVYAHPLEFPYLTGKLNYPEPDTSVEGGMLAKISSIYPHQPIDISGAVFPLPTNNTVPHLPGWRWIHTPGHSPGHISLFREEDQLLLSGDAFITVRQDSFYKVLFQKKEVNGPPRYLTTDWRAAKASIEQLQELKPSAVIPGHGNAMEGEDLALGLDHLVKKFEEIALPDHGKYVNKGRTEEEEPKDFHYGLPKHPR